MNFGGKHSAHCLRYGQPRGAADWAPPDGRPPLPSIGAAALFRYAILRHASFATPIGAHRSRLPRRGEAAHQPRQHRRLGEDRRGYRDRAPPAFHPLRRHLTETPSLPPPTSLTPLPPRRPLVPFPPRCPPAPLDALSAAMRATCPPATPTINAAAAAERASMPWSSTPRS